MDSLIFLTITKPSMKKSNKKKAKGLTLLSQTTGVVSISENAVFH